MDVVNYGGWPNCYRLSDGTVELIITGDVGPRVIRFGFVGGQNLFYEQAEALGKTGGDEWRLYGGHRLWHAPEHPVRTYYPDNQPVSVTQEGDSVRVTQPTEPTTGLQKSLAFDWNGGGVRIVHRLTNHGLWPVTFAPWALSIMAGGGVALLPLPPRGPHPEFLLPSNNLVLWPYTDMADPRWTWGSRYLMLRQVAGGSPQKLGAGLPDGWLGYVLNGELFVKRYQHVDGAAYPDMGCSTEVFTNAFMLELETLAPLTTLEPGQSVEHEERWYLFRDVPTPTTEADIDRHILPLVQSAQALGWT